MMNDDEHDDHPLSSNNNVFTLEDFDVDGVDDDDGGNDADLFGQINSDSQKASLFADVEKTLEESNNAINEHQPIPTNRVSTNSTPSTSFYRPEPNDSISGSSMYSTIYENTSVNPIPQQPPSLPPPPPPPQPSLQSPYNNTSTTNVTEVNFSKVAVNDPKLVNTSSLVFSGPSYWLYAVKATITNTNETLTVRRRFRHFVALEDRIHAENPGVILPPRPEKTPPLSDERLVQTMEFAKGRAVALQKFINELLSHPLLKCTSHPPSPMYTFLTFPQEDLGIIWTECSSMMLTRLTVSATRVTESLSSTAVSVSNNNNVLENDLEMRDVVSNEQNRLQVVETSIPKLLGYLKLLQEYGLYFGSTGMELSKLSKDVKQLDTSLSPCVETLAMALLKSARRCKKQYQDALKSLSVFEKELRMVSCYKTAFSDRKHALMVVEQTRNKSLEKTNKLLETQQSPFLDTQYRLSTLEHEKQIAEAQNLDSIQKAEAIGNLVKQECKRLQNERKDSWREKLLVFANDMKSHCTDQVELWELAKKKFVQA